MYGLFRFSHKKPVENFIGHVGFVFPCLWTEMYMTLNVAACLAHFLVVNIRRIFIYSGIKTFRLFYCEYKGIFSLVSF